MIKESNAPEPIGFWAARQELAGPGEWPVEGKMDAEDRVMLVRYLRDRKTCPVVATYRGISRCRLCGAINGHQEQSDGRFLWPTGYAHYVEDHLVVPPPHFLKHVGIGEEQGS